MVGIEKEINIAKFRTMVKDAKSETYSNSMNEFNSGQDSETSSSIGFERNVDH